MPTHRQFLKDNCPADPIATTRAWGDAVQGAAE